MNKPTYSYQEIVKLIDLIEDTKDLTYINKLVYEEKDLYKQDEIIKIAKYGLTRFLTIKGYNVHVATPDELMVKCKNCNTENVFFNDLCTKCKCQL